MRVSSGSRPLDAARESADDPPGPDCAGPTSAGTTAPGRTLAGSGVDGATAGSLRTTCGDADRVAWFGAGLTDRGRSRLGDGRTAGSVASGAGVVGARLASGEGSAVGRKKPLCKIGPTVGSGGG